MMEDERLGGDRASKKARRDIRSRDTTVIFTIARMNPPTSGHQLLIETMMREALDKGVTRANIILSDSVDNTKNPLDCEEKSLFLNRIITSIQEENPEISGIHVEITCMSDETPPEFGTNKITKSLKYIITHYENPQKLVLIIGEDRATEFNWLRNYIAEMSPEGPDGPERLLEFEVKPIDRPATAMSATEIRGYVTGENKEEFMEKMRPLGLNEGELNDMYHWLTIRLRLMSGGSRFNNEYVHHHYMQVASTKRHLNKIKKSKRTKRNKKNKKTNKKGREGLKQRRKSRK
jgi:hypothetical protein